MMKFNLRAVLFGICLGLAALGTGSPVHAQDAAPLGPAQIKAIEQVVRDYLMKNPELLIEAIQGMEAKGKANEAEELKQTIAARKDEIFNDTESYVAGNPKGSVTLVEFFDYRCPYCKAMAPGIAKLLEEDKDLRVVYKEFPVLSQESGVAAQVAVAALRQDKDKYLPLHKALLGLRQLNEESVFGAAKDVGLDVAALKRDMTAPAIGALFERNIKLATDLRVNGTPAFIIGEKVIVGGIEMNDLKALIAEVRAAK